MAYFSSTGAGKGKELHLIGTYDGNQSNIDVSEYIKTGDTIDNFIVVFKGFNRGSGAGIVTCYNSGYSSVSMSATTLSKTLNNNRLTISGASQLGSFSAYGSGSFGISDSIKYELYYYG